VEVANSLGLSEDELLEKLIEWGESLPFKIQDELIVVDNLDGFMDALDQQFASWSDAERSKDGKLGDRTLAPVKKFVQKPAARPAKVRPPKPVAKPAPRPAAKSAPKPSAQDNTSDMKDYHGTPLVASEWMAMMDLERALGGTAIPAFRNVTWYTFGFSAEQGHVTYLNLYKKGLMSLPETIGQLTSLKALYLPGNQLTSLPDTIGNLKSLFNLSLDSNKLSSLPKTIGNLKSLQFLSLSFNRISGGLPDLVGDLKSLPKAIKKWIKNLKKNGCQVDQLYV
jgi:Leucine-rich repeat (LRR) protein